MIVYKQTFKTPGLRHFSQVIDGMGAVTESRSQVKKACYWYIAIILLASGRARMGSQKQENMKNCDFCNI